MNMFTTVDTSFPDSDYGGLESLLSFYIRSVNISVSRDLDNKLSGLDVAKGTGKIGTLLIVSKHPGIRPSDIANIIMRDKSSMGRLLDKMELQGLLIRKASSSDQRSLSLYLTGKGQHLAKEVIKLSREQDDEFFNMITPEEKFLVINIFKKILQNKKS